MLALYPTLLLFWVVDDPVCRFLELGDPLLLVRKIGRVHTTSSSELHSVRLRVRSHCLHRFSCSNREALFPERAAIAS